MLPIGEIKILRSCYHPLFFQLPGGKDTVALLDVTRATSIKTKRSLVVHLFVLLLVRNITLEAILPVILLM